MFDVVSLLSGGVDKVVDSVGKAIDNLVTSDEEKGILKNELEKIKNEAKVKAREDSTEFEKEITKRWVSDNEHHVTRLVRPLSYIGVLVLFVIIVLFDGNVGEFSVNGIYIPVIESLLSIMTIAYFGSRGIEKVFKTKHNGKGYK